MIRLLVKTSSDAKKEISNADANDYGQTEPVVADHECQHDKVANSELKTV